MAEKRKISYEQSLALDRGRHIARANQRARMASKPGPMADEERAAFFNKGSTPILEKMLKSRYTPSADKAAIRRVLAEREPLS